MANCKELYKDLESQDYLDCVNRNKNESVDKIIKPLLVKEKVREVDPVIGLAKDIFKVNYDKDKLFKQGGDAVVSILNEYTDALPNLSYDSTGEIKSDGIGRGVKRGIKIKFTKGDGEVIESDLMSIGGLSNAEENYGIFKDFLKNNLSNDELTKITDSFLIKAENQKKSDSNHLTNDDIRDVKLKNRGNNQSFYTEEVDGSPNDQGKTKLTPNLNVFDSYKKTTKEVFQMGIKIYGGDLETITPYAEEVQANVEILTAKNLESKKIATTEQILEQAKLQTLIDLTSLELNKRKREIINIENQDLKTQAEDFVGTRVLKSKQGDDIKNAVIEQKTSINSLEIFEQTLSLYEKITNGTSTDDDLALIEKNLSLLNVQKVNNSEKYFKSGMQYDDYVKQGGAENKDLNNFNDVTLKNGVQVTRDVLDNYKNLYLHATSEQGVYKKRQIEISNLVSDIEDNDLAFELASKNYSEMAKAMNNIGVGFSDIGFNLAYGTGKVLNFIGKVVVNGNPMYTGRNLQQILNGNGIDKALDSLAVDYVQETQEIRDSFVDNIEFGADIFKDGLKFGKFVAQEFSTQVPIFATMMATGGYGSLVIGASTAAGKRATMAHEIATGKKEYTISELILKPIGYGLAEGLIAHYTTVPIIKANKLRFTKIFGKADVIENGQKAFWRENAMQGFVFEPILEAGGEALTTGLQNSIDGNPFTENMGHSAFSGFGMSLIMSGSSFSYGSYMARNSDWKSRGDLRNEQRDLDELNFQRQEYSRKLNDGRFSKTNKNNFKKAINVVDSQIKQKTLAVENAMDKIESIVKNNYREGHANYIKNFLSLQTKLQNDAQDILNNNAFNERQKSDLIKGLSSEFQIYQQVIDESLSEANMMKFRPEFNLLKNAVNEDGTSDESSREKYKNYIQEAKQTISAEGGKESLENIRRGAYELYVTDIVKESNASAAKNKFAQLSFTQLDTVEQAIDWINNDSKLSDEKKLKAIESVKKGADGFADKDTNTTVVVVDNQVKNQRKFTGVHEIGHQLFWNIFSRNSAAFEPIAQQLLKTAKQIDPKLYEKIITEAEKDENGNLKTQEVIMRFLEAAAGGDIKMIQKASGWKGLFGIMVQKEFDSNFNYNFDFKGETDIVNWVIGLGNKLKSGSLNTDQLGEAKETAGFFMKITDTQGDIEADSDGIAFSKGDGFANANIANELNLTNSTQNIVDKNNKVFDDIVDLSKLPENKGVELKDLVTQKMKNDLVTNNMPRVTALAKQAAQTGQNINLEEGLRKTFDDFNGEYALKLTELANSWNPAKNDSFGAYMNQLLPLKYSGILAKLKKGESDQTTRIDESTTQIADVSTSSSVDTVIEPKIDPLTFLPDGKTKDKFVKSLGNALKDATPEQLKNVSFANPIKSDKLLNEFADMFNLLTTGRDGKVKNPLIDKSFNFSDVNNLKDIQRQIIKNYQNLRNSMPKGNETVFTRKGRQGLVKEGGGSLALTTKFLNEYYTRLPKKISNNVQYKPKELSKNEWLAPLGIIDGKVDPNYTPRAGQAQTLKGMFDAIYKNVASQAADAQLKIDQQLDTDAKARAKANVRSGKSDLVFSNSQLSDFGASARTVDLMKTFRDGNFKNMTVEYPSSNKSIAKRAEKSKLKFDETDYISSEPRFIKDDNFKDARSRWLKKIAPLLNQDLLESSLIAGGPRSMFGKLEEVYEALGIKIGKKTPKQLKKEAAEFFSKTAPKIPTNFNYSRGKYAKMSPNQLRNHFNSKEFKANEKLKMPFLKDFAKVMQTTMKNDPEAEAMWAGFLASTSNMSKGIIRRMAPIKFFSLISQQKGNLFVEEHSMPANNIAKLMFYIAEKDSVEDNFSFIKDNYFQGQLRKLDDDKLKGPWFNYISTMPKEFFTMENLTTWIRYNNENVAAIDGGINFDTYEMVDTGKTVSQQLAQQAMDVVVAHVEVNNVIDEGIEANKNKSSLSLSASPEQLNTEFNKIIEETLGIEADKRFSSIVAKRRGAKKGKFRPFVPPSAEDFSGLMYDLYGYGKMGEAQMKWVNENLIQPYRKGVSDIEAYRYSLGQDYKALLKKFPDVKKKLGKTIPGTDFTYDQALRVNLWTRAGYEIPGISKRDAEKLNSIVEKDSELGLFNDAALLISKQTKWAEPDAYWDAQSILSDLNNITTKVGRKQFLEQFIANKEAIFSAENMNKLEAALGNGWRNAMEDSLYRMENGTNRPSGTNALTNNFLNWVNNSIGAIMFFNRKSALLQTISSVNFLNWSDNNPVKAAMAFANFPQFLKDFSTLWNSSKLKQRRSGLKSDINESEIANAVKGAKDKASAMLSYLLKIGFTPTQLADSFAIASGGATFYRNRINTYIKQGMPKAEAETKAFDDFAETSDVSQQSADPMLISQQQASILGRLLLAFQNTPSQVTRLFKKAGRDFKNNRGDQKTNISKMVYYGAIQGFIFAALSNAYFMLADEEDPEDMTEEEKLRYDKSKETKIARILNSMTDTILRGSGVYGAIVATLKNTILTYNREENKNAFSKDRGNVILELANLSPPIGSKLRKINNAYKTKDYNKEITKEMGWDVTYKGRVKLSPNYSIFASLTEGFTNLPLERAVNEFKALNEMMDERNSTLQRIALALGYRSWDVGAIDEESDIIRVEAKAEKKAQTKIDQQKKRDEKKRLRELEKYKGKTPVEIKKMKQVEVLMKTNKPEQITTLLSLGLTKDEIKKLKYEEDRVNKIIQLQDK
mgnify:FL=1